MPTLRDISEMSAWVRQIPDRIEKGAAKGVIKATTEAERISKQMARIQFTGRNGYRKTGNLMNAIKAQYEMGQPNASIHGRPLLQGYIVVRGQKGKYPGTKPYGRVHEFGKPSQTDPEPIRPRKAKHLWVKNWEGDARKFKDLTPTDFFNRMKQDPSSYRLIYPNPKINKQKIPIAWFFGEIKKQAKSRRSATAKTRKSRIGAVKPRGKNKRYEKKAGPKIKGPRWIPLFFLRKSVKIPERPFVRPAVMAVVGPNMRRFWSIIHSSIEQEP